MTRTFAIALSGIFAWTSLAQAQFYSGAIHPLPARQSMSSRYASSPQTTEGTSVTAPRDLGRMGSLQREQPEEKPRDTMDKASYYQDDFKPAAFIERLYVDVLGREPSDREVSYWLLRLRTESRKQVAAELAQCRPLYWLGHYDPRYGSAIDPGWGSGLYPDPASLNFRDPGGPFFKSPYFPNYEYRRPIRAFPLGARG